MIQLNELMVIGILGIFFPRAAFLVLFILALLKKFS